ncbi:hypothetical protein GCM10011506_35320 [Marivirga lumbricoides]|uniref:Carboxypeptidase regulatory-like domain-containing protein n=1 Tax=Marivirga lumbricoides TaxID=1046115 RepID=A0ABQ1MTG3_9BACT|nr:hypothetical protein GCM10011506_35320 [Marivirga lumbricoides]
MNKVKVSLLALTVIAFTFFQFIPKDTQFLKTNLRITIQDDLGNVQEGATVTLYENEEDYRRGENQVAEPQTTDSRGRVTFKDLEDKIYFVNATKGDMNNNMLGVQTAKLEDGKLNKVAIVIQ